MTTRLRSRDIPIQAQAAETRTHFATSPVSVWSAHVQSLSAGWQEVVSGFANWRIGHLLGIGELRRRYARSRLGQFWLVASTGIMVLVLGVVWSMLWKAPVEEMMPYIAIALVVWTLITGTLGEAPGVLVSATPIFLNQGMSFSTVIFALIYRQLLVFLHNTTIVALTLLVFQRPLGPAALLALPGFLLLVVNLAWPAYLIAMACARFRDLASVVANLLVIAFFVTPVFFQEEQIPAEHYWLIRFNPLATLMSVVRDPILGKVPPPSSWLTAILLAILGSFTAIFIIGRFRRRIIYWL
jgi:ABC-type polysaccharide/polyol phosphate export permease